MLNSRLNRRHFLQTAGAAAGAATLGSLASCGTTSTTGSTVTLNYWDYYVSQAPWVDNEIKLFQEAHPTIKIKKQTQAVNNYANLYGLAVRSKNTPDLALIPQTPNFNEQVQKGWWLPLDKYADDKWRSRFPEGTLHEGSNIFGGKLYSAPLTQLAIPFQLYINHSVFRNADLVDKDGKVLIPRTWDDVTHYAEQINKKSNGSVYGLGFGNGAWDVISWWMFVFIIGADCPGGGGNVDLRTGKYTYSSNRNYQDWLELWKSWKTKGYFYPDSLSIGDEVARTYFERGKFGMTVGGVWNQPGWSSHDFTDYSLTTLLTPKAEPDSYFCYQPGGSSFAISANTKHADETWQWFDWLYSVDAGKRWVQLGEDLSIFPQNNDPKNNTDRHFSQYLGTAKYSIIGPDTTVRNPNTGAVTPQAVKPSMSDIMVGYYTNQITDIAGSLKDLADRSQKALEDAIKDTNAKGKTVSINDYIFSDWNPKVPYVTKPAKS